MLKRGLPETSVRHSMMRDGVDSSILDKDPNEEIEIEEESSSNTVKKVKLCEHPKYSKYFTMLKRGLPETSVRHSMMRDGVDSSILDKDPNEEIEVEEEKAKETDTTENHEDSNEDSEEEEEVEEITRRDIKLCENPEYEQYFLLLQKGLPKLQVARMMKRKNKNISILDEDPNKTTTIEVPVILVDFNL